MAYFIFLKSLRSLGEFWKNPHVKIPPKSPCANFQSIRIFKNSIFIRKEIFFNFQPNLPSGQLAHPTFLASSGQAGRASPPGRVLPPSPSSLPKRADSAAASSRAAAKMGAAPPLSRAMERLQWTRPPSLTWSCAFTHM
jgi:hypothetical protein